jgi:hypothetical protein
VPTVALRDDSVSGVGTYSDIKFMSLAMVL